MPVNMCVRRAVPFGIHAIKIMIAAVLVFGGSNVVFAQCPAAPTLTGTVRPCDGGVPNNDSPAVGLDWNGVTWATEYAVYRAVGGVFPASPTAIVTDRGWKDLSPPVGVLLSYRVQARTNNLALCPSGVGPFSNVFNAGAISPGASAVAPVAGSILGLVIGRSCTGVTASWNPPLPGTPLANMYRVRVLIDGVQQGPVNTTTQPTYSVNVASDTQVVTFGVTLVDLCGRLGPEATITGKRLPSSLGRVTVTGSAARCDGVTISWTPLDGAESYRVTARDSLDMRFFSTTGSSILIPRESLQARQLDVQITAMNSCGQASMSTHVNVLSNTQTYPPLTLTLKQMPGGVLCSWTPEPGITEYRLRRIESTNSQITYDVGGIKGTSAFVAGLPGPGITYQFCVASQDSCGFSSYFEECESLATTPTFTVVTTPTSVKKNVNQSATLSAYVIGNPPNYQWRKNGTNLVDGGRIQGATTAELTISNLVLADADLYELVLSLPGEQPVTLPATILVTNPCRADFDDNGRSSIEDVFDFLNAWFAGC